MVLIAGVVLTLIVVAVVRNSQPSSQPASPQRSTPAPSANAQSTAAADIQAVSVAKSFTAIYLAYDWQHPPDMQVALKPFTSDRLYNVLIFDGTTPDGLAVPWAKVRPDLHEIDTVQIGEASSQEPGSMQAAIQLPVTESSRTDVGHSESAKEIDLSLQNQNGTWVVDWVSERGKR
jgi:hypothetical protein